MKDVRASPKDAGLFYVGPKGSRCGNCIWFDSKGLSCDLVKSRITADLCCNGWQGKNGKENPLDFGDGSVFHAAVRAAEARR